MPKTKIVRAETASDFMQWIADSAGNANATQSIEDILRLALEKIIDCDPEQKHIEARIASGALIQAYGTHEH